MTATRRTLVALGSALVGLIALWSVGADTAGAGEIRAFQMERSSSQAGGHPDVMVRMQSTTKEIEFSEAEIGTPVNPCLCGDPRRIAFDFPTGFIGNPHAVPKCNLVEFGLNKCPPDSQIGATEILFGQQPLYNMVPRTGEPGLLAGKVPFFAVPVLTTLRARTDSDYGLTAETPDIWHPLGLQSLRIWIWGVPTDPVHDVNRWPLDLQGGFCGQAYPEPCFETPVPTASPPVPYLQNPTVCGGAQTASLDIDYYDNTTARAETAWTPNATCDLLGFSPSLAVNPTTEQADSPSGIDVILRVPQTQSPTVPTPSQLRDVKLTFPEGYSINPNAADGKSACTDEAAAFGTLDPARCPETSKVGTLSITSTALPGPIDGAMYLGEPKPGDRYRLILTASGFETHVKLPGSVSLDPQTGRIVASFEDLPQSPLQEFNLHMFGAERGLLATPERCGNYTLDAEFVPWATVLGPQQTSASLAVTSGPNGGPCPGAARPLSPAMVAGSPDNTAGKFSPFALKVDRGDGEQNLDGIQVNMPPGFLASLRGIPYCPEDAIARLSNPAHSGHAERASAACPVASQVGTATTAAGSGSRPLHTPGKVYLAGPHQGAPLSLVVVVPAVSGPYDLGNVAVRTPLNIDPRTAQVTAAHSELPWIVEGIPLRLRSILVDLSRPNFTLNPTNCNPFSVVASIFGDEGSIMTPSAFYQVANCSVLGFGPRLGIRLTGATKRTGHPVLRAVLRTTPGEANLRRAVVALPGSLQLDNANVGDVCTNAQFAARSCPPGSIYGHASASTPLLDQPLSGPVYLRTGGNKLPDLVAHLRGQIEIELVGRIDTARRGGLRTTFATIPDAPVTDFVLQMQGGKRKGLLVNNRNLCRGPNRASIRLQGQNGMRRNQLKALRTSCGKKAKRRAHRARAVR